MHELPLFPLNIVLFPGMPLPLQIFEQRYKEMIALCVREKRPFGVVLIREGAAEYDVMAEPHTVGCSAQITQVEQLDESGRLLIITLGRERFRIHALRKDKPYLVGQVETLPLEISRQELSGDGVAQLRLFVDEYMAIMIRAGHIEMVDFLMPKDLIQFLYLAAALIQLPINEKQMLLEIDDALHLVKALYVFYRRELPALRLMPMVDQGIFSIN